MSEGKTRRLCAAALVLALAACSKPDTAPGPGGVTMGEARALDEAAAMLDERRPGPEVTGTQTGAGTSTRAGAQGAKPGRS